MQQTPDDGGEYLELLKRYVQNALQGQGQAGAYQSFVHELRELRKAAEEGGAAGTPSPPQLLVLLHALTGSVSQLHAKRHEQVVQQVLGMKLWSVQQDVRAFVLDLLINLVVANAAFLLSCLHMLVYNLLPPPAPPVPGDDDELGTAWAPSQQAVEVQDQILRALSKVMALLPAVPSTLQPLLLQQMPHKLRDRTTQCLYLRALFALAEMPAGRAMRDGILAGVVEHLLSVDVEIRWEDIADTTIGIQEEDQEEDEPDIFELEGLSLSEGAKHATEGWEGVPRSGGDHAAASTSGRPPVDVVADKLDSMMELTFEHLLRRSEQGGTPLLWSALLPVFERSVLHTQRSKFTQFLLFYVCSRQPQHCAPSLTALLLQRLADPAQPPITRAACAAYLASFLARAAFVPRPLLLESLSRLAELGLRYADTVVSSSNVEGTNPYADDFDPVHALALCAPYPMSQPKDGSKGIPIRHQVFYAMCQALLYVLCYHLHPLAQPSSPHLVSLKELLGGRVAQLLNHPLSPLRTCLPSVVSVFVQRLSALGLAEVANLPKHALQLDPSRTQRPLEMFFPFDPYLLRRSARYLDLSTSYLQWKHGRPATTVAAANAEEADGGDSDADTADHEDTGEHSQGPAAPSDTTSSDEDEEDDTTHAAPGGTSPTHPLSLRRPFHASRRLRPTSIAQLNSHQHLALNEHGIQPLGMSPMSMGASPAGMGVGFPASVSSGGGYSPLVGTSPTAMAMSVTPDLSYLQQHLRTEM